MSWCNQFKGCFKSRGTSRGDVSVAVGIQLTVCRVSNKLVQSHDQTSLQKTQNTLKCRTTTLVIFILK